MVGLTLLSASSRDGDSADIHNNRDAQPLDSIKTGKWIRRQFALGDRTLAKMNREYVSSTMF